LPCLIAIEADKVTNDIKSFIAQKRIYFIAFAYVANYLSNFGLYIAPCFSRGGSIEFPYLMASIKCYLCAVPTDIAIAANK
jgi:hypothetical protein